MPRTVYVEASEKNMKNIPALFLLLVSFGTATMVVAENLVSIELPPASLGKWYKPANKRQVWLHTMFRLRREMQAISEYAKQNDQPGMDKWISRLEQDYSKIADMVPEWKGEIKPRLIPELELFAKKGDSVRLGKTLTMLQRTCDDCHADFQPLVSALYRSPYYDEIQVKDANGTPQDFDDSMKDLSESVNRILIALNDDHKTVAMQVSQNLAGQFRNLGDSCNSCHKEDEYPRERILGEATRQRLDTLQVNISEGRVKDSQKLMGEIAVTVCARCHNTHRIVHDLRNTLLPQ